MTINAPLSQHCLVIGGSGFIGSHLLNKLVADGYQTTSLDRSIINDSNRVSDVRYITGNYADKVLLEGLLSSHDCLIHLAYATQPNTSFDNPFLDLSENVPPTIQLFELAAKHAVRVLFVSSGGTVYGEALSELIEEDHPTNPISPYGVTKLTLEKYACLYAVTRGLDVVVARPSNPFGEGQKAFVGQGFIATGMALALQGKAITIFGDKGTVRDYLYISDLVTGLMMVLEKGESSKVYNIGSSIGRSNLEVVSAISSCLLQSEVKVVHQKTRSFDVRCNVLDSARLHALGWRLEFSFEEGLKRMLVWMRKEVF